jgi:hypothetical protein
LRTAKVTVALRRPRIELAGRVDATHSRANGTLRVTGQAPKLGRCDSRTIRWSANPL